jgi:alkylation response protein AidB-like acyl-CoA dehydrogenase
VRGAARRRNGRAGTAGSMMPASFDNIVLRPPAELVANIAEQAAANQAEAQALDRDAEFPVQGLAGLARAGALLAVLPRAHGGNGFGTDPAMALQTATLLISIGRGSIALGRIFEAHMNAVRLIVRHGTEAQTRAMAQEVRAGALFGLWVTNDGDGVELLPTGGGMQYRGAKIFCSAARHATHALITARHAGETVMCIVKLGTGECVRDLPGGLAGVRGARTGCVDFSFVPAHIGSIIGAPGAYLAEPDFSTGAWRALAVSVGAMEAIVEATRAELLVRGRADAPQQRERFGRMMTKS